MVWLLEPVLLRVPPAPTGVSFVFSWPLSLTLGKASVTVGKDLHWGLELGILFRGRVSPDAKAMGCVWSSAGFNFQGGCEVRVPRSASWWCLLPVGSAVMKYWLVHP